MLADTEIYNALNVSSITSLIELYNNEPALFADPLIPSNCDVSKTINFYLSSPYDVRENKKQYEYITHCRAPTKPEAVTISEAVVSEINRKSYDGYYLNCQILPTIGPADPTDNYSSPVLITIKKN